MKKAQSKPEQKPPGPGRRPALTEAGQRWLIRYFSSLSV